MISEYDLRQIYLMEERIKEYKEGKIYIHVLINNLEALANCLEDIDEKWVDDFISVWSVLEIEYASALNNNKKVLDGRAMIEINRSLEELNKLINSLLKNDDPHISKLDK